MRLVGFMIAFAQFGLGRYNPNERQFSVDILTTRA